MMLRHIGEGKAATTWSSVRWRSKRHSHQRLIGCKPATTTEFTQAVVSSLGKRSKVSPPRDYKKVHLPPRWRASTSSPLPAAVSGVDVYIETNIDPNNLRRISEAGSVVTVAPSDDHHRGAMVFPRRPAHFVVDHFGADSFRTTGARISERWNSVFAQIIGSEYRWMHSRTRIRRQAGVQQSQV